MTPACAYCGLDKGRGRAADGRPRCLYCGGAVKASTRWRVWRRAAIVGDLLAEWAWMADTGRQRARSTLWGALARTAYTVANLAEGRDRFDPTDPTKR